MAKDRSEYCLKRQANISDRLHLKECLSVFFFKIMFKKECNRKSTQRIMLILLLVRNSNDGRCDRASEEVRAASIGPAPLVWLVGTLLKIFITSVVLFDEGWKVDIARLEVTADPMSTEGGGTLCTGFDDLRGKLLFKGCESGGTRNDGDVIIQIALSNLEQNVLNRNAEVDELI